MFLTIFTSLSTFEIRPLCNSIVPQIWHPIIINIIIVIIFESKPSECLSDPEGWTDQFSTDFTSALKIGNRIPALPFANKKIHLYIKCFWEKKIKSIYQYDTFSILMHIPGQCELTPWHDFFVSSLSSQGRKSHRSIWEIQLKIWHKSNLMSCQILSKTLT